MRAARAVEAGESLAAVQTMLGRQVEAARIITANDIDPSVWWVYLAIIAAITAGFRALAVVALARRAEAFY